MILRFKDVPCLILKKYRVNQKISPTALFAYKVIYKNKIKIIFEHTSGKPWDDWWKNFYLSFATFEECLEKDVIREEVSIF